MERLIIDGGYKLSGRVRVQGAKNGALPILAATLIGGRSVIHNCPHLSDIENCLKILKTLGCNVERKGCDVFVTPIKPIRCEIPPELMRCMRSSVIFLGAMLSRCGRAVVSAPGGCELGDRPIDLHLSAMRAMGASIREEGGFIICETKSPLCGADIALPFPSVGATENILLAAARAKGRTVLTGAAREPEIVELAEFINAMGGRVSGAGSDRIVIDGVASLGDAEHTCIPDRIVAATYIAAAVTTGSCITLCGINRSFMDSVLSAFVQMGCTFSFEGNNMTVFPPKRVNAVRNIRTMPYPGFPTDAQAVVAATLVTARGTSVINETVFGNRFRYISELKRMGADADIEGSIAVIRGVTALSGASVECTDLRGGAALVVAALGAKGRSFICKPCYIDRGYENIEGVLSSLGAKIIRT